MSRYNMNVLADAKEEYTRQLISVLTPEMYIGIKSIYDAALNHCDKVNDKNVLQKFQILLSSVPQWNQSKVDDEFKRIVKKTDCDFIEDLITAVFVSHTKVLSSIQIKKNNKTIPVNVPLGAHFTHKCYIQCARNFWRKAWLLDSKASSIDVQRNIIHSETLINESIKETIRKLLPVRHILKEYLNHDFTDDDIIDNIEDALTKSSKDNLRKLVRNEIQTLSKSSIDDNFSRLEIPQESLSEFNTPPGINYNTQTEGYSPQDGGNDLHDNIVEKEPEESLTEELLKDEPLTEELLKDEPLTEELLKDEDVSGENKFEDNGKKILESKPDLIPTSNLAIHDDLEDVVSENTKIIDTNQPVKNYQDDIKLNKGDIKLTKDDTVIIEKIEAPGLPREIIKQNEESVHLEIIEDNFNKKTTGLDDTFVENYNDSTILLPEDNLHTNTLSKPPLNKLKRIKNYDNIADYSNLDRGAQQLKEQAIKEDSDNLDTLSNKSAINQLKKSIKDSHENDTNSEENFSFFNDAVQFY